MINLTRKIALVAAKPLTAMAASGAMAPIAPVASVSSGDKSQHGKFGTGEDKPRRGIPLTLVLSGLQPSALMASPSHSMRATTVSAIIIPMT